MAKSLTNGSQPVYGGGGVFGIWLNLHCSLKVIFVHLRKKSDDFHRNHCLWTSGSCSACQNDLKWTASIHSRTHKLLHHLCKFRPSCADPKVHGRSAKSEIIQMRVVLYEITNISEWLSPMVFRCLGWLQSTVGNYQQIICFYANAFWKFE